MTLLKDALKRSYHKQYGKPFAQLACLFSQPLVLSYACFLRIFFLNLSSTIAYANLIAIQRADESTRVVRPLLSSYSCWPNLDVHDSAHTESPIERTFHDGFCTSHSSTQFIGSNSTHTRSNCRRYFFPVRACFTWNNSSGADCNPPRSRFV